MGLPHGLRVHARPGVGSTVFSGQLRGVSGWGKLAAATAVAQEEPGRRIVWIDDDLAEQADDVVEWLDANLHVLVVAPDLFVGLTHEQLDEIRRGVTARPRVRSELNRIGNEPPEIGVAPAPGLAGGGGYVALGRSAEVDRDAAGEGGVVKLELRESRPG